MLLSIVFSQHRSYNDKYEYRKKRHEVTLGVGASNCLTDLGGSFISDPNTEVSQIDFLRSVYDTDLAKSNFSFNAAYIYHFKRKLNFRGNLVFAKIGADDAISDDLNRQNRNLNFKSNIVELSGIVEYYFAKPITGNKFNLKDVQGHKLAPNFLAHWGFYIMGGVGGFYYNPKGLNNKVYNSEAHMNSNFNPLVDDEWYSLRPLHTEGQGMYGNKTKFQKDGKTYSPIAICFPVGFGLEKAFNGDMGLKIEASYRFTTTDYLDDVSSVYYNRDAIIDKGGNIAGVMSGTNSGWPRPYMAFVSNTSDPLPDGATPPDQSLIDVYGPRVYTTVGTSAEEGFVRGDPTANDSYMFFNISFYKNFSSHTKWYRNVHHGKNVRIKASF
ncbi:MAG: hypothetical protein CL827_00295 [Crocinitomicaceae bacterium]|nr:hypothetical protein [Crocinitomicaceae bacterium]